MPLPPLPYFMTQLKEQIRLRRYQNEKINIWNLNILPPLFNSWKPGELRGLYGKAFIPGVSDYYTTEPFGDEMPLPPQPQPSTQRGFYNEEFAPLKLDTDCKHFSLFDSLSLKPTHKCVSPIFTFLRRRKIKFLLNY